jgi:O-antigen ligase
MQITSELRTRIVLLGAFLVTVTILPNWSYDPVSAPKLLLLTLVAGVSFSLYLLHPQMSEKNQFFRDKFALLIYIFVLLLVLNVTINHYAFAERIYGVRGRATGFLAFISLSAIAFVISKGRTSNRFFFYLLISNIVVCGYFLLQIINLDFFTVENFYSAPSSTLGNPNFVSGFVGFSIFVIFYYFDLKNKISWLATFTFLLVNIFVLYRSQSIQGIIGVLVGILVLLLLNVIKSKEIKIKVLASLLSVGAMTATLLGFLGLGPLSRILESSTVFSRLDYWRSAARMSLDNWLFGVGLDGYGDFYRVYRDQAAIDRFGSGQTADSAHNVFLDMFASGGLPLGVIFLVISIYPAAKLFLNLLKNSERDRIGILLLAIWAAFQLQAFVSVNQIGVSIWGWILLGLIVAHGKKSEEDKPQRARKDREPRVFLMVSAIILVIAAPLIATPQMASEVKFLSFANRADGLSLDNLVSSWPQDSRRMNFVARGWENSEDPARAKALILKAIAFNPNFYPNWAVLIDLPNATTEERENARQAMKRLDPLVIPER